MTKTIESIYIQDYNKLPHVRQLKVCSKYELLHLQKYNLQALTEFKQDTLTQESALYNTILFKYQNTQMVVCYKDELLHCRSLEASRIIEQEELNKKSLKTKNTKKPKNLVKTITKLLDGLPPEVLEELKKQM